MESLFFILNSIRKLKPELEKFLRDHLKHKLLLKKETLLQIDEVCQSVYFIEKGLVYSSYFIEKNGKEKEVCNWIYGTNDVIISVYSFYQQKPSYEHIKCLENTSLYYLSLADLQYVYENFIDFNYIGRVLTQKYYLESENQLHALRKQSSKERYQIFIKQKAHLLDRLPQHLIASYLGIDNATLSRLKNEE